MYGTVLRVPWGARRGDVRPEIEQLDLSEADEHLTGSFSCSDGQTKPIGHACFIPFIQNDPLGQVWHSSSLPSPLSLPKRPEGQGCADGAPTAQKAPRGHSLQTLMPKAS